MKKRLSREVKIGIFGLAVMIFLYLGVNFIKSRNVFSKDNTFYAVYNQAEGIEVSSPVVIKGFRVGTIEKVSFDIKTTNVIVKMTVKKDYPIPVDSKAKIASSSLLGGKQLELQLGRSDQYYSTGDTVRTVMEPSLMQIAGSEYEKLKTQASTMIEQVSKALFAVNEVLSQQNVENLSATLANLESVSKSFDRMVGDKKSDLNVTLGNVAALSQSLRDYTPMLESSLFNIAKATDSLPSLVGNATSALDKLNGTLSKMERGEGTLGKIVNDEGLYSNLNNATLSLDLLLKDIKTNPKRYINVSVFGKNK